MGTTLEVINPVAEIPHLEVALEARAGTPVIPVAATLEIQAAVVRAEEEAVTQVEVTLAAAVPVAAEVIPAVRVVGRISRRTISTITFNHKTVESLTSGPIPLPDR